MELKYKITAVNEGERGIEVQYYTDALVSAQESVWISRADQLWREGVPLEDARAQAVREYPVGARAHLTFYGEIPTGEALHSFIVRGAPLTWLEMKDRIARGDRPDMSALHNLQGVEHVVEASPPMATPSVPQLPTSVV